jgi:penicillin-binding protein 2
LASTGVRSGTGRFLPPDPRAEQPYRLTPQLAFRVAILGALALLVFGVLFFRLWALQVLSGPQYLHAALNNQLRTVRVEAPRGLILDRNGHKLVTNVGGTAVQIAPADLPKHGAYDELVRLSKLVNVPLHQILVDLAKRRGDPVTPVTVKEGVGYDLVSYLSEHQQEFPGVHLAQTYLRHYPYGAIGAQLFGYVSEISSSQLKYLQKRGYHLGDKIGQAGVEASYDGYLRGRAGLAEQRVDSLGKPIGQTTIRRNPEPGETIRLTIDAKLQRAAEDALTYGISVARGQGHWASDGGAIVALDPRDGSILAMASNPTYDPSIYSGHASRQKLARLLNPIAARNANYPSLNRAIAGTYPAGSTFKPITALAAMQEHLVSPYDYLNCTGQITIAKQVFKNWDPFANQAMTMPTALAASCDTYFYQLGYDFYLLPPERGHPLQNWARRFGYGRASGVDVGPESTGLLPTPEWRQQTFTRKTDPCCWQIDRLWKPGDSVQLAIGQKDLLVTPLQQARFYALIANGGKLVKPHVVEDVEQPGDMNSPGQVIHRFAPPAPVSVGVDPAALAVVGDGLYQATHASYGTSVGIFGNFPIPIAGKTGTAEKVVSIPASGYTGEQDQSWWCGYGPTNSPEIVVCALIENGGHGGTAAAPAALKVFESYFHIKAAASGAVHSD